ncbi:unnamed protein product (macronuclear) [Paramecium tetraurelia]|uniref:U2A'/phosphoprotein 32 family A C-terminal domain-containing protein n=1 Tax=Paramecium tetraurelia TaxID=5888 RepID=A0DKC8_PARTE|nr:uncharacterized protein GSPATT00017824001 [Paramecium tetraurelia]CAK83495.1 unnamed protein product [Paramecium tetraurelia]|eukprot:XP_001450892.1 hypothetical protein (macronuclear) [Paramecium tetraurelia strain d4-2]
MEQLKKLIQEQVEEQDIVEDLNIDGVKITKFTEEMAALFTQHQQLLGLSFEKCGLTTLDGFPKLKKLQNLEFENNSLTGTAIKFIADNFKELINLNLSQNNIKSVDDLKPLASLTKLESLELKDNPLTKEAGYHKKVFQLLPSLKVLDNKNEKGEEVLDDEVDDEDIDDDQLDEDDSFDESEVDDEESEEPVKPTKKTKK